MAAEAGSCLVMVYLQAGDSQLEAGLPTLPLMRLHLLEVLQHSQLVPPTGNQGFRHTVQWGIFNMQTTTVLYLQRSATPLRNKFLSELVEKGSKLSPHRHLFIQASLLIVRRKPGCKPRVSVKFM